MDGSAFIILGAIKVEFRDDGRALEGYGRMGMAGS